MACDRIDLLRFEFMALLQAEYYLHVDSGVEVAAYYS